MSQSATLYRITTERFRMIEKMEPRQIKPAELADSYVTFMGSFMGLEATISKASPGADPELVGEIFNPIHYIGPTDSNIFSLDSDEEEQFWEMESAVGYLAPNKVKKVAALLRDISEDQVAENYNADELNADGIYPSCWHNEDGPDKPFNKRQIRGDFRLLSDFFQTAANDDNYVLSYVG